MSFTVASHIQYEPKTVIEAEPMIDFQNVTRLYGTVIGVNDICLSLPRGGYGLVGPNGSGKTTLLNLLLGQLRTSLGDVRVFGQDPFKNRQLGRLVGYCPSLDGLYATVTGESWLRYMGELSGLGWARTRDRVATLLDQVGMTAAKDRTIATYSQGMRQRIKLAQAMLHEPELLVLDEPFNGLDPVARHDLIELLKDWLRDGKSLILASHVLHEVEAVTQTFVLIRGGRLLAQGSAREVHQLLAHLPSNIRITTSRREALAQQLLSRNLVDAVRLDGKDGELFVSTRRPHEVYAALPSLTADGEIPISRVESSDDSLQSLFDKLYRMHRGEL
jgi:ABC-2 type transport system ATP-binding protein